ncbi:MAG: zinc ribbon domain-containing protein [Eubacteriales bacterium]|nr:zinc ribbon domain-containing protein [Eubacteriales bacterium]
MFCSACGHEVEESYGYCPNCGKKLANNGNLADNAISIVTNIFNSAPKQEPKKALEKLALEFAKADEDENLDMYETTQKKISLLDSFYVKNSADDIKEFISFALSKVDARAYRPLSQDKLQKELNNALLKKAKYAINLLPEENFLNKLRPQMKKDYDETLGEVRKNKRIRRLKLTFIGFVLLAIGSSFQK